MVDVDGGSPRFSVLWRSSKFASETRGDGSKKTLSFTDKAAVAPEKQSTPSLQKSLMISDSAIQGSMKMFDSKGLFCYFSGL